MIRYSAVPEPVGPVVTRQDSGDYDQDQFSVSRFPGSNPMDGFRKFPATEAGEFRNIQVNASILLEEEEEERWVES